MGREEGTAPTVSPLRVLRLRAPSIASPCEPDPRQGLDAWAPLFGLPDVPGLLQEHRCGQVLCTVGAAAPRRCLLSHYRSLEPRTLAAAKALRDRYVSDRPAPAPPEPWHRWAPTRPSLSRGVLRPSASRGRGAELGAAQLLLPPQEGSSAAVGEARNRRRGRHGRMAAPFNARASPQSCAWLRHVARGIADAQAVLSRLHRPELLPGPGSWTCWRPRGGTWRPV
ncbi:hypothetical protein P7K49_034319 [Saguinus oedipus]|uniref:Uncharacterized protein n=1 Tax=Saguinus oedipus TaxID=9490 RepID=A0ABQ9TUE4_SAGOE|nr:hypothetical protein P7K49_034319 [Saguinus oedipus]